MATRLLDLGVADVSQPAPIGKKPKRKRAKKGLSMRINTKTGEMHVTHMSEVIGGRVVKFDGLTELVALSDASPKRVWNQIAKCGAFAGHPAGPFELNAQVFSEIVRNFHATHNRRIPVDFEHASESDPTSGSIPQLGAPAQAWIVDLDNRGEAGLWGLFEWLEPARQYVADGKYKFFSPAVRFGARDRVTGKPIGARMTSGALTNAPFLDSMQPLVCADYDTTDRGALDVDAIADAVAARLCALDDEDDDEGDDEDDADERNTNMAEKESAVVALTEAQAKNSELTMKLSASEARAGALEGELKTLRDEKSAREEHDLAAEVDRAIAVYADAKGATVAMRPHLLSFARSNREGFRAMYPQVEAGKEHLLRNLTERRDPTASTPAVPGVESTVSLRALARQLASERGISLADAQRLAVRLSAKGRAAG